MPNRTFGPTERRRDLRNVRCSRVPTCVTTATAVPIEIADLARPRAPDGSARRPAVSGGGGGPGAGHIAVSTLARRPPAHRAGGAGGVRAPAHPGRRRGTSPCSRTTTSRIHTLLGAARRGRRRGCGAAGRRAGDPHPGEESDLFPAAHRLLPPSGTTSSEARCELPRPPERAVTDLSDLSNQSHLSSVRPDARRARRRAPWPAAGARTASAGLPPRRASPAARACTAAGADLSVVVAELAAARGPRRRTGRGWSVRPRPPHRRASPRGPPRGATAARRWRRSPSGPRPAPPGDGQVRHSRPPSGPTSNRTSGRRSWSYSPPSARCGRQRAFGFGSIDNPIRMMGFGHDRAGDLLAGLRVSGRLQGPRGRLCQPRSFYERLARLGADTHEHIHKENNVLFPAAVALAAA